MIRTLRRFLVAVAVLVAVIAATAGVASAHASVVSTNPADLSTVPQQPADVSVTFSEGVSANSGGLSVRDREGVRVDTGDGRVSGGTVLSTGLKANLPKGTYVATYRVLSADGHPVSGSFIFGIGVDAVDLTASSGTGGDRTWEIIGAISRFVMFLAALLSAGLAFFIAFIHDQGPDRWRLVPVVRIGSVIALFGAVGVVMCQAALLTGDGAGALLDGAVVGDVLTENLGWSLVVMLVGLAGVHLSTDTSRLVLARSLALYGGLAVTISFAIWGHASELPPTFVSLIADAVHATAAGLWFGGLVGLAMILRRRTSDSVADTGAIIGRFSTMAMDSVIALVIAGLALSITGSGGSPDAMVSTTWGRLVLAKAGITLGIVAIAAWNRRSLVPALVDPGPEGDIGPDRDRRWAMLLRTVRLEAIAIVVVLALTAVVVNVTPARTATSAGSGFDQTQSVDTGTVNLTVTPARVGMNAVHVQYFKDDQMCDVANTMTIEFSLPSEGLAPITRQVVKAGPGHFIAQGPEFSMPGIWTVTLVVRTGDFSEQRTSFEVPITR